MASKGTERLPALNMISFPEGSAKERDVNNRTDKTMTMREDQKCRCFIV
jgi:hypothetical protein